jgi:hypothetical protein
MNNGCSLTLAGALVAALLAAVSQGQATVDASGPIREGTRIASQGRGGGVGKTLPLKVAIEINVPSPDLNGKTLLEFVLTNSGKDELTLPVSPNPGDFEPSDRKVGYTVMTLALLVGMSKRPGVLFPGGADLFGNAAHPGTLMVLAPGDSLRVLARVALPPVSELDGERFDGTASLASETIKTVEGKLIFDSREIGFARSRDYTAEELLSIVK